MNTALVFVASAAAFLILGSGAAKAGQTINDVGAMACVNDKWDVKEPEKGHKLVDYAGRCVNIPDDATAPKSTGDCVGMEVGRVAGPALMPLKVGTRSI